MSGPWIRDEAGGLVLALHVQPGAARSEVAGVHGEGREARLRIRLAAPPVDGKANAELRAISRRCVRRAAAQRHPRARRDIAAEDDARRRARCSVPRGALSLRARWRGGRNRRRKAFRRARRDRCRRARHRCRVAERGQRIAQRLATLAERGGDDAREQRRIVDARLARRRAARGARPRNRPSAPAERARRHDEQARRPRKRACSITDRRP